MSSAATDPIDLVCWDFGDTLVDEMFMRLAPAGIDNWEPAFEEAIRVDPNLIERLDLGQGALHEVIEPLSSRVAMTRPEIARHLRAVFDRIDWLPGMREIVTGLDGRLLQAVVTVNPHEFGAMAVACGLEPLVDVIVTSADMASLSKPVMAVRARELLGLAPGLGTTLLVDNKAHNTDDFLAAGGQAIHYEPATFAERWAATGL